MGSGPYLVGQGATPACEINEDVGPSPLLMPALHELTVRSL